MEVSDAVYAAGVEFDVAHVRVWCMEQVWMTSNFPISDAPYGAGVGEMELART